MMDHHNTDKNQLTHSEVHALSSLVTYQNGSIVSRIIIGKTAGNITAFSFDAGQELSEHTAPFDALVQIMDGKAEIIIGGISHKLGSGELIIMPANIPHAVKAPEKFKMLLTMLKA
jgi:quercetin dioxygenase-like cupin family protein